MTSIPIACYGLQSHLGVTIFVLASSVSDSDYLLVHSL